MYLKSLRSLVDAVRTHGGEPEEIRLSPADWKGYFDELAPQVRYTDPNKTKNLMFKGIPVIEDATVPKGELICVRRTLPPSD